MAIWMDLTNSMFVWKGGVVGIIRAELEIAKNMRKANPDIRFFGFDGRKFVSIDDKSLTWLWESDSVGDAYLSVMRGTQKVEHEEVKGDAVSTEELRKQYPGLENAYCYSTSRLHRGIWGLLLYANTLPKGIQPIVKKLIDVISKPLKKLSLMRAQRKEKNAVKNSEETHVVYEAFSYPFADGDIVFSCGWMYSGKEAGFEKIKQNLQSLFLIYLVYDIILVKQDTKQFYDPKLSNDFKNYLDWISMHCDAIFYGGSTAMKDTQEYQKENFLPVPPGFPVYFGSDIVQSATAKNAVVAEFAKKAGIQKDFILAVGSLDERKNYSTMYRSITILAEREPDACPQLVIVGKGGACNDLRDTMERDPSTKDRIRILAPTDEELNWLYRNAKFVVLASAWEGWSLTLPEALQYGKLTIASDVAPLREVGQSFAAYVDTFDPFAWADKISYYIHHPQDVEDMEVRLRKEYHPITWKDCGEQIAQLLSTMKRTKQTNRTAAVYMDISLAFVTAMMGGNITGILRTELMLAKYLYRRFPAIKFFALNDVWGYMPIDVSILAEVLTGENLDADFNLCRGKFAQIIPATNVPTSDQKDSNQEFNMFECKRDAYWFLISVFPTKYQKKLIAYGKKKKKQMLQQLSCVETGRPHSDEPSVYEVPFLKGDVVFTAGTGSGADTYQKLLKTKEEKGYRYCPIIYDYTPILLPQVHQTATIEHYAPFLEFTSKMADFIFYGGETARHDGIAYQKQHGLPIPPSCAIRFGSDIKQKAEPNNQESQENQREKELAVLKRLGINGPFVMAVGTMEMRKNHETLYRAYLRMIESYEDIPQMVFCGHPGWKVNDFLAVLHSDDRVKDRIIQISPTDEELDILYKNCEFTVLASLYEGWSLTLPESYWYGKFCLCCDTPALKETAGDLAEYIHRWDEKTWSERIHYYHTHPKELEMREKRIAEEWHPISWAECAEQIMGKLITQMEENNAPSN